jgi:hypothetical protein
MKKEEKSCKISVCIDAETGKPVARLDGDCPPGALERLIACVATDGINFRDALRDRDKKKSK